MGKIEVLELESGQFAELPQGGTAAEPISAGEEGKGSCLALISFLCDSSPSSHHAELHSPLSVLQSHLRATAIAVTNPFCMAVQSQTWSA